MKKQLLSVIVLGVLGGLFLAGNSWSQNAAPRAGQPSTGSGAAPGGGLGTLGGGGGQFGGNGPPGGGGGVLAPPTIELLMIELRAAEDDATKEDLTKKLEAAIVKNFDEDMTSRETDLTQLEERLTKLRAQLDRRRKAKAEIIQLHLKVIVNEADGLGFSGASVNQLGVDRHGHSRFRQMIDLINQPDS